MRAIIGILEVAVGILLFLAAKKCAGKQHIPHRGIWGLGICFALLFLYVMFSVIGNKNQIFRSPEEAYRYNNQGEVKLVINGEESDMVVGKKLGEDDTEIIAILPKSEAGWGVSSGLNIKQICSKMVDGIYISVWQYKDTGDYYIKITDLFEKKMMISDNFYSDFSCYTTEEKKAYSYYASVKNFSIQEYEVEINGKVFTLKEN